MADQYTQQQATDYVNQMNATMVKVSNEVDGLVAENKKLQDALAAAGGPGGTITPELANAIKATGTRIDAVHEVLPDVPQPE